MPMDDKIISGVFEKERESAKSEISDVDANDLARQIHYYNEQLFIHLIAIIRGLNSGSIRLIDDNHMETISDLMKKLDLLYEKVRDIIGINKMNKFKSDHFYFPVYYMYERVVGHFEGQEKE